MGLHLCHTELGMRPSLKTQVSDKEVSQKRCKFESLCRSSLPGGELPIRSSHFFFFLCTDVVFYQAELKRCFWKSTLTVHRI